MTVRARGPAARAVRGFTLIELAVTLTVMALLGLMALPFTMRWIHGAQVAESLSLAVQGYGHAKSVALRNPAGVRGADQPAAGLKLVDGHVLLVCAGDPADAACAAGGAAVAWQTDLGRGAGVTAAFHDGSNAVTALALANTAQVMNDQAPASITVSKGSDSDTHALH